MRLRVVGSMHYEGDGGGPAMAAGTVEAMVASGVDGGGARCGGGR